LIDYIGVTAFADLVPGMGDRAGCQFSDRVSTIVAVLTEGFGNDSGAQNHEGDERDQHDGGESKKVFDVLEQKSHPWRAKGTSEQQALRKRYGLRYRESGEGTMIEVTGGSDGGHVRPGQ